MANALHVDQYRLTGAQRCWRRGMDDTVSYEIVVRKLPPNRNYLVFAGLGTALWHLRRLRFTVEQIDFLDSQQIYDDGFLNFLRSLEFTCDVDAMREGTIFFAHEPVMRITGPRTQAKIVESVLLSIINHQTMIASKAARMVHAANGRPLWDFSLRRLHGPDASLGVARAAFIAGFAGTATVEAGRILKIPLTGTMAHDDIMEYGRDYERQAFMDTMEDYPDTHALLIDTYNTRRGIERAILASRRTGIPLNAVRIDSGDLYRMSKEVRSELDRAGMKDTKILVSNDQDEHTIYTLVGDFGNDGPQPAPIDAFGVGTMLGTSADSPHLGGVYKLVQQHDTAPPYIMKLTKGKETDPGCHQVWRTRRKDILGLTSDGGLGFPLLSCVMADGRIVGPNFSLQEAKDWHMTQIAAFPQQLILNLENEVTWPVERTPRLWHLRAGLGDITAHEHLESYARPTDS